MGNRVSWNTPGHLHALTFTVHNRVPVFNDSRCAERMVHSILATAKAHELKVYSYVVMPDHVHIVLHPHREEYRMDQVLHFLKRRSSSNVLGYLRSVGDPALDQLVHRRGDGKTEPRFWLRGGGYDRNLYKDRTIKMVLDYVHNNPVRKGLCEDATHYPWSSAEAYYAEDETRIDFYQSN